MSGIIAQNSGRHTGLIKAGGPGGVWNLIQTLTASTSSDLSFTSGINSSYDEYVFIFINLHPSSTSEPDILVNFSSDGGSNYNVTKTTTLFRTLHGEDGGAPLIAYYGSLDHAETTGAVTLGHDMSTDADSSMSGFMHLFAPSDTTFVKHFHTKTQFMHGNPRSYNYFASGYCNTTSAVNAVQFSRDAGTIDSGSISLYGIA